MKISQEFYEQWKAAAKVVRPHQEPPSKEQMEQVLDILTPEQQEMIIKQFEEPEKVEDYLVRQLL